MQEPDNFAYVIPVDLLLHTEEHPFCFVDGTCPCHEEDQEAIALVNQWIEDGLMTSEEAIEFVKGRTG